MVGELVRCVFLGGFGGFGLVRGAWKEAESVQRRSVDARAKERTESADN